MNIEVPIVIFAFNRPVILKETLSALKANVGIKEHTLIFFCDGPKENSSPEQLDKIMQVKQLAESIDWCKQVVINTKDKNVGLANSLVGGITEVLKKYEAIIVLEDDIKTSPFFVKYMIDALTIYKNDENVISISGFNFPFNDPTCSEETFFLRGANCWGWATWRRGWKIYENDGQILLNNLVISDLTYQFDYDGNYIYSKMLRKTIADNHSWAVKWHASAYLKKKLTLYPKNSLTENIGIEGTNVKTRNSMIFGEITNNQPVLNFTQIISENFLMREKFVNHFKKYFSLSYRIKNLFRNETFIQAVIILFKALKEKFLWAK